MNTATNLSSVLSIAKKLTQLTGVLLLALFLLHNAWVSEDAYITFRSVEQLLAGNGPRWNPHERVQAFTHPLWFGLLACFRIFSSHLYLIAIGLGVVLSAAAALLISLSAQSFVWSLLVIVLLSASKAWVDFSTSGLENALSHLLIICAALLYQRAIKKENLRDLPIYLATISLLALCRHDLTLIFIPVSAQLLFEYYKTFKPWPLVKAVFYGLTPFLAWTAFSLFYYGFPFPNTAYAKLSTGLPISYSLAHGYYYFRNSLLWDPLTILTIAAAVVLGFCRSSSRPLAIGILLYLLYVLWIGGDFMSGRFFTAPFVLAIFLLATSTPYKWILIVPPLIALSVLSTRHPWWVRSSEPLKDQGGIADERAVYWNALSLTECRKRWKRGTDCPSHNLVRQGLSYSKSSVPLKVWPNVGLFGYYSGIHKTIIDPLALTDPLLARLPVQNRSPRIGHFTRKIPNGYLESIIDHKNKIQDPQIAQLWSSLELITQGPLWSFTRLIEIAKVNIGLGPKVHLQPHMAPNTSNK